MTVEERLDKLEEEVAQLKRLKVGYSTCDQCEGSGNDGDYYNPESCKKCAGSGEMPVLEIGE